MRRPRTKSIQSHIVLDRGSIIAPQPERFVIEPLESRRMFDGADLIGTTFLPIATDPIVIYPVNDDPSQQPESITVSPNSGYFVSKTAVVEGTLSTFTGTLAKDAYTANVDWGDGTVEQATIIQLADGSFAVVGSHTYADSGVYYVGVDLLGSDDSEAWDGFTAMANAGSLNSLYEPGVWAFKGDDTPQYVGGFYDVNPTDPSDYAVTIDWGDGSSSAGSVEQSWDGKSFDILAGHSYADTGDYSISVTVTKKSDPTSTLTVAGAGAVYDTPIWINEPVIYFDGPSDGMLDSVYSLPTEGRPLVPTSDKVDDIERTPGEVPTDAAAVFGKAPESFHFPESGGRTVWSDLFKSDHKIKELDSDDVSVLA